MSRSIPQETDETSPGSSASEKTGLVLVAVAAILWGLLGPVARVALAENVQPLELSFWRAAIAGVLCLILAGSRRMRGRRPPPLSRSDAVGVVGFGIVGVAVFFASYFFAVELAGAALAAILLYTAPAWVALASAIWLGERLTKRATVAIAITLAGIVAVSLDGAEIAGVHPLGIVWGLVAGISYALYYLIGRRYFARYGALNVLAYALPVGALALLPFVDFSFKSPTAWLTIAFIAAVPTFAAYLIYGIGVIRVAGTRAATVAAIEPLVAATAAFAFWGERFGTGGYIGSTLVLAGVFIAARGSPRRVVRQGDEDGAA